MDFRDFSRRLYRWASEGVDMYDLCIPMKPFTPGVYLV